MTKPRHDDSVSPMTRSPMNASPAPKDSATSPYSPPKGNEKLLPPLPFASSNDSKLGVEIITELDTKRSDRVNNNSNEAALPHISLEEADEQQDTLDSPSGAAKRNVQFAQPDVPEFAPGHSRHNSVDGPETPGKSRSASFMSKLKSFTSPNGLQSPKPSYGGVAGEQDANALSEQQQQHGLPDILVEEQSDVDADVDDTADEENVTAAPTPNKKKRRMRRFIKGDLSAPSTPGHFRHGSEPFSPYNRFLRRRASMPDAAGEALSEGEAKDPRHPRPVPRRGHSWVHASMNPPGEDIDEMESSAVVGRRHGHVRRITVFGGGGVSDGDAMTPRRPFFNSELRAASTFGAQKWKQVKSTLKLLRQKKEDRFDYFKSAELMAELRAGAPAVLMLASMIQRDEHGNKRIPVLLEQLKLKIKDSSPMPDDEKERHWIFTMELEYGSGPSRMVWTVSRTIKDIYNLHFRYKFAINNDKYMLGRDLGAKPKQPKFPYSAFPYLRGARNKDDSSEEEVQDSVREGDSEDEENHHDLGDAPEHRQPQNGDHGGIAQQQQQQQQSHEDGDIQNGGGDGSHRHQRKRSRVNMLGIRRRSTSQAIDEDGADDDGQVNEDVMRQRYVEKQRRILEKYLSEMIRWLMFRADSNRLCRFLELSALGVRLAAEGSYHGKECYLHIQTSKGLDFRRVLTPAKVISRHSRKWFLVRQSYIVCVESPENMNIYDVYLVDSKFSIVSKRSALKQMRSKSKQSEIDLTQETTTEKHHTLTLHTSERKVRLFSRNNAVMKQFEESLNEMLRQTVWHEKQRFDSYAPVRTGVFAQWLVDGRDYMWNVSRAINMAKDVIYIHDWWLSPELYMRRPACISQKWRLDRLLQKKAREGVKIFIIIYRNVEAAIPIDSEYTKFSLLNLHPNIFVQRSPNQFKKNQFFFAHHEKICVVDHDVAFLGGVDLCFGRWDCPQHPIVDDKPTGFEVTEQPKDAEHCQLFAGKDYSNPRVQDFFRLNEPYEEMYDRGKVPRMPWHDIGMQVVGQPARDLTRHFVQRWNYLRRGRKSTRPLPFLLPPPDAKFEDLEALGLTGTCEVQMLRSAANWSLGLEETEFSVQTAYVKMIEDSDHFVYIENQFFITSTEAYNTKIVNRIGDALVARIIRAHENGQDWRCVVVIPLIPGFQNTVDEQEGTSVRLIVMCQYRSICRGEHSIFGRLRAAGIDPEKYISFFSLRQWGIMSNDALVTEQLYIHAKAIIVDDRVALIGSANINERSMLGTRDSECAAIVRDTDMIWSTMGGKPYQVGRFAHTLRLRLMREHLGLDTDQILEEERQQEMEREAFEQGLDEIYSEDPLHNNNKAGPSTAAATAQNGSHSFNNDLDVSMAKQINDGTSSESESDSRRRGKQAAKFKSTTSDVSGLGIDNWKTAQETGLDQGRDSVVINGREVLVHGTDAEGRGTVDHPHKGHKSTIMPDNPYTDAALTSNGAPPPAPAFNRQTTEQLGLPRVGLLPSLPVLDDSDIGGPSMHIDPVTGRPVSGVFNPIAADIRPADITKDCMQDPITDEFIEDIWNRVAKNNTKLYRRVFRCMPDSAVTTWAEYRDYVEYNKKFKEAMDGKPATSDENEVKRETSTAGGGGGGGGVGVTVPTVGALAQATGQDPNHIPDDLAEKVIVPANEDEKSEAGDQSQHLRAHSTEKTNLTPVQSNAESQNPGNDNSKRKATFSGLEKPVSKEANAPAGTLGVNGDSVRRRRRATTKSSRRWSVSDEMPSRAEAGELLKMVQGNLVQFPYDWLLTEEHNGNWGYQVDGVAPLAIYN